MIVLVLFTFPKPLYLPHAQCKENNMKKKYVLIIHNKKSLPHSAGLAYGIKGSTSWLKGIKVSF